MVPLHPLEQTPYFQNKLLEVLIRMRLTFSSLRIRDFWMVESLDYLIFSAESAITLKIEYTN